MLGLCPPTGVISEERKTKEQKMAMKKKGERQDKRRVLTEVVLLHLGYSDYMETPSSCRRCYGYIAGICMSSIKDRTEKV